MAGQTLLTANNSPTGRGLLGHGHLSGNGYSGCPVLAALPVWSEKAAATFLSLKNSFLMPIYF